MFDNEGTPLYMRLLEGSAACIMEQPNGHLTLIDGSIGKKFFELDSMFMVLDTFFVDGYITDGHDFDMDEKLESTFIGLAISTGRGILFEKTSGTIFSKFIFPIINPMDLILSKKIKATKE